MPAGLGLHGQEGVGGSPALVLAVAPGLPPRFGCGGRSHIRMPCDGLLVRSNHRLLAMAQPFKKRQDILHVGDIALMRFGNTPHFFVTV